MIHTYIWPLVDVFCILYIPGHAELKHGLSLATSKYFNTDLLISSIYSQDYSIYFLILVDRYLGNSYCGMRGNWFKIIAQLEAKLSSKIGVNTNLPPQPPTTNFLTSSKHSKTLKLSIQPKYNTR